MQTTQCGKVREAQASVECRSDHLHSPWQQSYSEDFHGEMGQPVCTILEASEHLSCILIIYRETADPERCLCPPAVSPKLITSPNEMKDQLDPQEAVPKIIQSRFSSELFVLWGSVPGLFESSPSTALHSALNIMGILASWDLLPGEDSPCGRNLTN